jgi:hypothetical protein
MGDKRQADSISAIDIDIITNALRRMASEDGASVCQTRQQAVDLVRELTGNDGDEEVLDRVVRAAELARLLKRWANESLDPAQLSFLLGLVEEVSATTGLSSPSQRTALAQKALLLFSKGTLDRQLLKIVLTQVAKHLRRSASMARDAGKKPS